jgi:hypothetical protein
LANAIAEYNDDLQEVEDGFVNRINNQQNVNDAFNDNEPEALACAHVVVIDDIDDIDDTVGDDFVFVDNTGTVQALESSVNKDTPKVNLIAPSLGKEISVLIVPSPIATSSPVAASSPIATSSGKDVAGLHEARDKITAVFALAVAVIDIKFTDCPHTINNVIEYADAMIFKLSIIDIHSAQQLCLAVKDGYQVINNKLSQAGHSKLKINTISLLRKESLKCSNFTDNQYVCAYNDTIAMIGEDDKVNFDGHSGVPPCSCALEKKCHHQAHWFRDPFRGASQGGDPK